MAIGSLCHLLRGCAQHCATDKIMSEPVSTGTPKWFGIAAKIANSSMGFVMEKLYLKPSFCCAGPKECKDGLSQNAYNFIIRSAFVCVAECNKVNLSLPYLTSQIEVRT
jgi:hypothetical protein